MTWKTKQCFDEFGVPREFSCGGYLMGVLNVTPDSFSDGGQHNGFEEAIAFVEREMECADIIDVGGESTRPGSSAPSIREELDRVLPVVTELVERGYCVSIDTRHWQVAQACVEAGVHIINDVSGFRDPKMREVAANSDCGLVVMHMLGEPGTMQEDPHYDDVVSEVESYLLKQAAELEALGIGPERICIDPGPGFGKTWDHNQALISSSARLASHGYPLMVAVSRKSYIGSASGIANAADRDLPSILCSNAAIKDGALVARIHNVPMAAELRTCSALIALGSNMGDRRRQLDDAVDALRKVQGIWVYKVSSYVESEPAYKEDQACFANAVARIETSLSPMELLDALHTIENAQGRVRHEANGPRTLDLDVLDYEAVVSDDPVLTLPHPRILERDFVVTPLLEISPDHVLADGKAVTRDTVSCGMVVGKLA